jgi:hypothetical protein
MKVSSSAVLSLAIFLAVPDSSIAGRIGGGESSTTKTTFDENGRSLSGRKMKKLSKGGKATKSPKGGPVTYEPGECVTIMITTHYDL